MTPQTYEQIDRRISRVESLLDQLNTRMDQGFLAVNSRMDQGFEALRVEIRRTSERSDRLQYAVLGFLAAAVVALVAALLTA